MCHVYYKAMKVWQRLLTKEIDPAFRRRAKLIFENIGSLDNKVVLDVGCGRGFYVNALKLSWPTSKVTGVDLNPKYLELAQKNKVLGVELIKGDASKLPFRSGSVDRLVSSELLEHVDDDLKVLKDFVRVLKPGGIALISVPCKNYPLLWDPLNWFLERVLGTHVPKHIWWLAGIWADHERLYSLEEIVSVAQEAGFEIEKSWNCTQYCLPGSHFLLYGIGKNLVEAGLAKDFDRFSLETKPNLQRKLINWMFDIFDNLNQDTGNRNCVNIVLKLKKL